LKKLAGLFLIPLFLTGCSNEQTIEVSGIAADEGTKVEIEDMIRNTEEVQTGTAILVDDELLVAIQVNPLLGYKEQKIEKRLQKEIEEKYPDLDVLVSSDFKMHWETQKLLKEDDEKKVTDEMKKLKSLAKEET